MDKLTLEHLAPYLPYGIRVTVGKTERNLTAISLDSPFVFVSAWKGSREKEMLSIEDIKPILRPVSDLTKEIEHNGKRFIPIEWFEIGDDESENWFSFDHGNINLINDLNNISTHKVYHDINFLPYAVVQKIIEWHFDVFGLIEKGLAISTNGNAVTDYNNIP